MDSDKIRPVLENLQGFHYEKRNVDDEALKPEGEAEREGEAEVEGRKRSHRKKNRCDHKSH